jgi:hypothetical protein
MSIFITLLPYLVSLVVGGAGGYLYGAKVKSTVAADVVKAAAVADTVKADVKKI